jgi:transposase
MGGLANHAQKEAIGIVRAAKKLNSKDFPEIKFDSCPGNIFKSKDSTFDYWIILTSQWRNKVEIPANSHRKLNDKLRKGWVLSKHCEFYKSKNSNWYLRVFVTKKVEKPESKSKCLGVDVGLKHSVARSDGYLGPNLSKVIKSEKQKQADRQRNHHPKKPFKTIVKQLLDHEVTLALGRSKIKQLNLVVEHPKAMANLSSGKLQGWARSYFANRLSQRAREEVFP